MYSTEQNEMTHHYVGPSFCRDNFVDFGLDLIADQLTNAARTQILNNIGLEALLDVRLRLRYPQSC